MMEAKTWTRRRTVMQRCVMTKRATPEAQLRGRTSTHRKQRQTVLPEEVTGESQQRLAVDRVQNLHESHSGAVADSAGRVRRHPIRPSQPKALALMTTRMKLRKLRERQGETNNQKHLKPRHRSMPRQRQAVATLSHKPPHQTSMKTHDVVKTGVESLMNVLA